jgi:glucose-1-phosphate thymidylyltransferase
MRVKILRDSVAWFDTGSFEALFEAAMFVKSVQSRTGHMIGCIEEVSYHKGNISIEQLVLLANLQKETSYGQYLLNKYDK